MNAQSIDHIALLPTYLAAATAVAVLLADLICGRRWPVIAIMMAGFISVAVAAICLATGPARQTFCTADGCSYATSTPGALIIVMLCALSLAVLVLSIPTLASTPSGEYGFLLACSLAGGVVLANARDLITIIIALETLTLPLYVLVAMRGYRDRRSAQLSQPQAPSDVRSAESAVSFLLVSVTAGAVTLFGAALLYAVTGQLHLAGLAKALDSTQPPLTIAAVALLLMGMSFKVAAVPWHAWAPITYDGAPLPVAAYLSTASKLGGVAALLWLVTEGLAPVLDIAGPILAIIAVATMTVGNLGALRQTRTVPLLAWSSIAQAGYLLVPFGGFAVLATRSAAGIAAASTAILGFAVFYVVIEMAAFAGVAALRGREADGGRLSDLSGAARTSPWVAAALCLALIGLAGLPPGLAGLFAKVTVVASVAQSAPWLAVVVAVNAVIGLVYYLRFAALLWRGQASAVPQMRDRLPAVVVLSTATVIAILVGFVPELVLGPAGF